MSAFLPSGPSPRPLSLADLRAAASTEIAWLWQGYLLRGGVSLLTSQWKAGKTTLLALLLARMKRGGSLAGQAIPAGKALVLSEEDPAEWCRRSQALDLDGHVHWMCRPFLGKPTRDQWHRLLDDVLALRRDLGIDLLAIDPLSAFLPGSDENNAAAMLGALSPLHRLTEAGMGVLLLHHPGKAPSAVGRAARGSGALQGFVDVLMEMTWLRGAGDGSRARRLRAWSRSQGTPLNLLMELTPDGTDYQVVTEATAAEDDLPAVPEALRLVLEGAQGKMTRQEILDGWLPDYLPAPDPGTLARWLLRAVTLGQLCRDGTGRRNEPFRYWLPEQEKLWRENDNWWFETRQRLEEEARAYHKAHPVRAPDG
jgi:hypothetical protein